MWRAFFLAIGVFLVILGVECLGVERVQLRIHEKPPAPVSPFDTEAREGAPKQIIPPPWAPWSLLSSGDGDVPLFLHDPAKSAGN